MKKNIFFAMIFCLVATVATQAHTSEGGIKFNNIESLVADLQSTLAVSPTKITEPVTQEKKESKATKGVPIVSGSDIMVQYSISQNITYLKNIKRTFISEIMLKQVRGTSILKNAKWNVDKVLDRLTALLILSGGRSDIWHLEQFINEIKRENRYQLLLDAQTADGRVVAFCHPVGKDKIDELILFQFNNKASVIQMTGKLKTSDLENILKISN